MVIKEDPRKVDDRVAIDRQKLEEQLRSPDRNPDMREPINRHAHDDRRHRD